MQAGMRGRQVVFFGFLLAVAGARVDAAESFKPDPLSKPIEWNEKVEVAIPALGPSNSLLVPTTPSQFAAIGVSGSDLSGAELWDLASGKNAGSLKGKPSSSSEVVLSPDGKYLALKTIVPGKPQQIEVWSFETGEMVCSVEGAPVNMHVQKFDFAAKDRLMVYSFGPFNGKFVQYVKTWEIATGRKIKQIDFKENVNARLMSMSQGRGQLAWIEGNGAKGEELKVISLASGAVITHVPLKGAKAEKYSISWECTAFDPTGNFVALLGTEATTTHLVIVDLKKKAIEEHHTLAGNLNLGLPGATIYKGQKVVWLADGKTWLLFGSIIVDRETGLLVWQLKRPAGDFTDTPRVPTAGGLLAAVGPFGNREFRRIEIPAKEIDASLEACRDEKPARLRPGGSIELKVEVGAVRFGTPNETKASLTEILTERLAGDGIEVTEGAETLLHVMYSETAGQKLDVVKSNGPGLFRGTATGQQIETTRGAIQLTVKSSNGKETFWSDQIALDPSFMRLRQQEVNEAGARKNMFESIKTQVTGLPLPYFIPAEKGLSLLPVSTELPAPDSKAGKDDRLKKKIDAKKKMLKKK